MTKGGAISDLNNLLKADDIPTYYKPSIKKIIETVEMEQSNSDEDCISRQQALYQAMYVLELETSYDNEKVEEMLRDLPSIQPKKEWIPVSERLPEKSGLYLVTNRANEIEVFSFTGHDMARVFWSKYAKAWMPLPEPYTAEKE